MIKFIYEDECGVSIEFKSFVMDDKLSDELFYCFMASVNTIIKSKDGDEIAEDGDKSPF